MYLSSKKINTKLFLWSLFFIQLFLISIFLLFSSIYNNNSFISDNQNNVVFIDKLVGKRNSSKLASGNYLIKSGNGRRQDSSKIQMPRNTSSNQPIAYIQLNSKLACFREGTIISKRMAPTKCNCLQEWHGTDCGQPEVIWRAFMTSKIPIASESLHHPQKIFYIIQTSGFSIETLEIQIMELIDIVDLFIICDQLLMPNLNFNLLTKEDFIRSHLAATFMKKYLQQGKVILVQDEKCSGKRIYKKMLEKVNGIDGNDVLLYSKSNVIFNRKAINYLKWYANWPQPIRFRLKYNYYGFFWQHPDNTIISGTACQMNILNEIYKSDPDELEKDDNPQPSSLSFTNTMIVGDLNHCGGWYCKYCAQPNDIIKILELDNQLTASLLSSSPNYNTTKSINLDYIQKQIADGLYNLTADAKHKLIKLYRSNDKYYVPDYVKNNSWKFDNIVINLFAKWDDNDDEY